ncbi:MAG: ABC transporter permease [Succinivibrionaceae bacterium]|nr:ABC transporter permease [Succinivibrionaceae bacterium]
MSDKILRLLARNARAAGYAAASFLILLTVWELAARFGGVSPALLPAPSAAASALAEIASDGTLADHIASSLYRFAVGFSVSVLLAVILGVVFGWYNPLFRLANPVVQLLRPISPIAWMPFIVLMFGIGDMPAIVTIFIAAVFPVFLSAVAGVRSIPEIYLKVARNFGVGPVEIFWKIIFPASFPQIMSGIHLALGSAWVFLVCGEMIGAQSGLGYLIIDARNNLRSDILVADIAVIGLIGFVLDSLIRYAEGRILKRWGLEKE